MDAALKSLSYRGDTPDLTGMRHDDLRNDNRRGPEPRQVEGNVEVAPEPVSATRVPAGIEAGRPRHPTGI